MRNQSSLLESNKNGIFQKKPARLFVSICAVIIYVLFFHAASVIEFATPYLPAHDLIALKKIMGMHNISEMFILIVNGSAAFCLIGFFKQKKLAWLLPLFIIVIFAQLVNLVAQVGFIKTPLPLLSIVIIYCWVFKERKILSKK